MKRAAFIILVILSAAVSCSKVDQPGPAGQRGKWAVKINPKSNQFTYTGGTFTVKVAGTAPASFTLPAGADWLTVTESDKKGSSSDPKLTEVKMYEISAGLNDSSAARSADIIFYVEKATDTLHISQDGLPDTPVLKITGPRDFVMIREGGEIVLEVTSTVDPVRVVEPKSDDWLKFNRIEKNGLERKIYYDVAPISLLDIKALTNGRSATITISDQMRKSNVKFTVSQYIECHILDIKLPENVEFTAPEFFGSSVEASVTWHFLQSNLIMYEPGMSYQYETGKNEFRAYIVGYEGYKVKLKDQMEVGL